MADELASFNQAKNIAIVFLRASATLTPERIRSVAEIAISAVAHADSGSSVDLERLDAELRHLFSVTAEDASILEDREEHEAWLPSSKSQIDWRFWHRYVTYLEQDVGFPPPVVAKLDDSTDMVLERLENPKRRGHWDCRGMVVGSVQSGKTAHYIGLICKAIDSGYKLIVVLAGIHNSLRAQTQLRMDEGVLGFDSQKSRRLNEDSRKIGVGTLPGDLLVVHSLTSSAENGDFKKKVADNVGVMLGSDPVVLVIKKNVSLLRNLTAWVQHIAGEKISGSERRVIRDVPLLLIDDEADNASINTKAKPGADPHEAVTAINGKIRKLLDSFEQSAYVGYTATPFANIFINPESEATEFGEDLFPRSFILSVKPPTDYIGPVRVFGLDGDPDADIAPSEPLPIVRQIDDFAGAFPPKHKKDHEPRELPDSLRRAIRCFLLVCAARRARGQVASHNSMLVHVTRFVHVQRVVADLVKEELSGIQRRLAYGDGERRPPLRQELEALWKSEFVPVSRSLDHGGATSWEAVEMELHAAAAKVAVIQINGYAKEALDYREHEADGRSVIAIGGDKLSRGLTLEGLSISYFLRTSRMYDTLMQMGRWFGYRPGYLDLCRLFTTRTLVDWYRHIALAEVELRREFDYMVAAGLTPTKFGLRVRTHPDGMLVTALNKMSHGRTLELSWSGVLSQTTQLSKSAADLKSNLTLTEDFLRSLGGPIPGDEPRATKLWRSVPGSRVASLVADLRYPPASARASGEQLARFIIAQVGKRSSELSNWTVALVSSRSATARPYRLGSLEIGLIERSPESQSDTAYSLKKANILSPGDEALDFGDRLFDREWLQSIREKPELADDLSWLSENLGQTAREVALALTIRWQDHDPPKVRRPVRGRTDRPNGRVLRSLRSPQNGLLLIYPLLRPEKVRLPDPPGGDEPTGFDSSDPPIIGIAISFPTSETTLRVEYKVNKVWGLEMEEDASYED